MFSSKNISHSASDWVLGTELQNNSPTFSTLFSPNKLSFTCWAGLGKPIVVLNQNCLLGPQKARFVIRLEAGQTICNNMLVIISFFISINTEMRDQSVQCWPGLVRLDKMMTNLHQCQEELKCQLDWTSLT